MQQYNCPNCNAPVVSNDKFCWHCGTVNCWSVQQQIPPPPPEPPSTEYIPETPQPPPAQQPPSEQSSTAFKLEAIQQIPPQQAPPQKPSPGYQLEPPPPTREAPVYQQKQQQPLPSIIRTEPIYNQNTSGLGKQAVIPPEIQHWNWGAFFLTWIWGIRNDTWIALISLIPIGIVQIVMAFVLGAKGNEWAWRNKNWASIEHFQSTQKTWCRWGIGIFIVIILMAVLFVILLEPFAGPLVEYTY